jgi:hypothetical protein
MSLAPGTRLGPYQVLGLIGAGGGRYETEGALDPSQSAPRLKRHQVPFRGGVPGTILSYALSGAA